MQDSHAMASISSMATLSVAAILGRTIPISRSLRTAYFARAILYDNLYIYRRLRTINAHDGLRRSSMCITVGPQFYVIPLKPGLVLTMQNRGREG